MSETGERRRRREQRSAGEETGAQPTAAPEWLTTAVPTSTGARPATPGSRRAMRLAATGATPEVPDGSGWPSIAPDAPATPGHGTPAWATGGRADAQPARRSVLEGREQPAARATAAPAGPQLPAPAEPPVLPTRPSTPPQGAGRATTPGGGRTATPPQGAGRAATPQGAGRTATPPQGAASATPRRTAWAPVPASDTRPATPPAASGPVPAAPSTWSPVPSASSPGASASPAVPSTSSASSAERASSASSSGRASNGAPHVAPLAPVDTAGQVRPGTPPAWTAGLRTEAASRPSGAFAAPENSSAAPTAPSPVVSPTPAASSLAASASAASASAASPSLAGSSAAVSPSPAPAGPAPVASSVPGPWFSAAAAAAPAAAPKASSDGEPALVVDDAGPLVAYGHSPFPSTGVTQVAASDQAADDEPASRRHPYTWLHVIVLAIVAFVLGFLIVALWNQGRNGAESESGTAAAAVVETGPAGSSSAV